jgi:hypothetical protein
MNKPTHVDPSLTQGNIILWVEDNLTKAYLNILWKLDKSLFNIRVGGGKDVVRAVVHDLRNQYPKVDDKIEIPVFGFIDIDFTKTNYDKWQDRDPEFFVYIPDTHEIENYLLDWNAIASCNANYKTRSINEIKDHASNYAKDLCWWIACKKVLANYHLRLVDKFPWDPSIPQIKSLSDAKSFILEEKNWYNSLPENTNHILNNSFIDKDLSDSHDYFQNLIENDTKWFKEFSGKELFRDLRGYVFRRKYDSPANMDIDLAKSIGEWQCTNKKEPKELLDLKDALKARVGI